ncbi:competence type IV pilus minor pilin ComGD [Guptibacillus algicola]|uniref:competence type IV pilus minor pilin ComGD n=1 Tax=Guptibacillus algicola TaxID=225844 RepID=UPI001CD51865|nr:competence type IV pilus minor pilin ComGD [Alkalihalobacillus algicola]MCA0986007.1 prepilin-type N-terminal cleavage/methylation domain-containing protein [Alkalihalobacillus algicola]
MYNKHHNEMFSSGYTLIEMMIVLTVFSLMLGLVFIQIAPTQSASSTRHFLEKLQSDIRYTQELAYSTGKPHRLSFSPSTHTYTVISNATNVIKSANIPENITIKKGTLGHHIVYVGNGNIQTAGTILINDGKEEYKLVVQLGAGRFYIEKR